MRSLLDLSSLLQVAWSFDPQGSVYSNRSLSARSWIHVPVPRDDKAAHAMPRVGLPLSELRYYPARSFRYAAIDLSVFLM